MIEVTSDEWADFLVPFKCYHTEPGPLPGDKGRLQTKQIFGYDWKGNIIPGEILAEVRYHDNIHQTYHINKTIKP